MSKKTRVFTHHYWNIKRNQTNTQKKNCESGRIVIIDRQYYSPTVRVRKFFIVNVWSIAKLWAWLETENNNYIHIELYNFAMFYFFFVSFDVSNLLWNFSMSIQIICEWGHVWEGEWTVYFWVFFFTISKGLTCSTPVKSVSISSRCWIFVFVLVCQLSPTKEAAILPAAIVLAEYMEK